MRPSDIRPTRNVRFRIIEYLSEDIIPEPGKAEPVILTEEFTNAKNEESTNVRKWYASRVLYFTAGTSGACIAAVAAVPSPAVQATACAVWAGSLGLAKLILHKTSPVRDKSKKAER
jgi:hypothetical protein